MKSYKMIIAISAITLLVSVYAVPENQCDVYKCSDTKPSTATGQCYKQTKDSNGAWTYEYNQCEDEYYCYASVATQILGVSGSTSNCTKIPNLQSTLDALKDAVSNLFSSELDVYLDSSLPLGRVDGQKCKKDSNCFNGTCSNEKCTGKDEGASCVVDSGCKTGFSCIGLKCTAQRKSGESCTTDYNCENSMACSNGKCVSYYSQADGSVQTNPMACSSAVNIMTSSAEYKCDTPTIKAQDCSSGADTCTIEYSNTKVSFEMGCQCTMFTDTRARTCSLGKVEKKTTYNNRHTTLRYYSDVDYFVQTDSISTDEISALPECYKKAVYNNLSSTLAKVSGLFIVALLAFFF